MSLQIWQELLAASSVAGFPNMTDSWYPATGFPNTGVAPRVYSVYEMRLEAMRLAVKLAENELAAEFSKVVENAEAIYEFLTDVREKSRQADGASG